MADVLLNLLMPDDVAQHVEDLLLSRPDLIIGFTASPAEGHGSAVNLSKRPNWSAAMRRAPAFRPSDQKKPCARRWP